MIIIVDYFLYNINNATSKKYSAELNITNGLLKVQADYYSKEGKPELIVNFFNDSHVVHLSKYKFEEGQDALYYITFLREDDIEEVQKIYLKHQHLFN
jgi:hypothetical protein